MRQPKQIYPQAPPSPALMGTLVHPAAEVQTAVTEADGEQARVEEPSDHQVATVAHAPIPLALRAMEGDGGDSRKVAMAAVESLRLVTR